MTTARARTIGKPRVVTTAAATSGLTSFETSVTVVSRMSWTTSIGPGAGVACADGTGPVPGPTAGPADGLEVGAVAGPGVAVDAAEGVGSADGVGSSDAVGDGTAI